MVLPVTVMKNVHKLVCLVEQLIIIIITKNYLKVTLIIKYWLIIEDALNIYTSILYTT